MAEIIPDNAIYDFLVSKGVEVEPPKSSKSSKDIKNVLLDGAITGLNPLAGAANMGLKQMGQGSKQQEWTTWKQWALVHADWNTFWEANRDQYFREQAEREANEIELLNTKKNSKKPGPASYMRRWGIGMIIYCSIGLLGIISDPKDKTGIPGVIMLSAGGIYLTLKGNKNYELMKRCTDNALDLLEKNGSIDIIELSSIIQTSESRTRLILDRAQKRNWIPSGIKII
mgnify:CR=1 FL=1